MTILWSLAQLHHQPDGEWMAVFFEAAEPHLSSMTGNQLAQLGYALGQLGVEPPQAFMEAFLTQVGGLVLFQLLHAVLRSRDMQQRDNATCPRQRAAVLTCCCTPGCIAARRPAAASASTLQCQVAMAADGMGGRDAASLLAALATLQHTPK